MMVKLNGDVQSLIKIAVIVSASECDEMVVSRRPVMAAARPVFNMIGPIPPSCSFGLPTACRSCLFAA